jgi:hypothetical protein
VRSSDIAVRSLKTRRSPHLLARVEHRLRGPVQRAREQGVGEAARRLRHRDLPRLPEALRVGAVEQPIGRGARHADIAARGGHVARLRQFLDEADLPLGRPPVEPFAQGDQLERDGRGDVVGGIVWRVRRGAGIEG